VPAPETPRVPLIIHAPTLEEHGVIFDVEYQHYDFGPTLHDVLELPPPEDTQGVSAFAEERPERVKTFYIWGLGFYYDEETGEWRHLEEP
jgi:arylsulfatase A-like enzyme